MKHSRSMPSRLRIGPFNYRVEQWSGAEVNASNRIGECDRLNHVIRIADFLKGGKRADVVMHEVLHGLFGVGRLHMECKDEGNGEGEENIISRLAPLLIGAFRDNPDLMPYLMQEINREA